jgi:molybdate transport system substrate-binding protein
MQTARLGLHRRYRRLAALLLPCLVLACSEQRAPGPDPAPVGDETRTDGRELTIFAAASLRDAFEALARDLRRARPGVAIRFHFAGSQELRTQIEHGAPADVFAPADRAHLDQLVAQGLARPGVPFARNRLVVIVPEGATRVKALRDLPGVERIVIGGPEVPVGRYTRQLLARATARWPGFEQQVMARVVSQELNVRQVLAKIALGEGDAAIVYRTDALASADKVDEIPIPADLDVVAEYPIAALSRTPRPALAQAWIDHVRSPAGQAVLARFGFEPPATSGAPASAERGARADAGASQP